MPSPPSPRGAGDVKPTPRLVARDVGEIVSLASIDLFHREGAPSPASTTTHRD